MTPSDEHMSMEKAFLSKPYSLRIVQDPEMGYYIEIEELPGVVGSGHTLEEAVSDARDSMAEWFEYAVENKLPIPEPLELRRFNGQFLLRMPKSLHRAVTEEAVYEGVSINSYLNILITENRHIRALHKSEETKTIGNPIRRETTTDERREEAEVIDIRDIRRELA